MLPNILLNIALPIFILIGLGYLLNVAFTLDTQTLSRMVFYVFAPAIIFTVIVDAELTPAEMTSIGVYSIAQYIVILVMAWGVYSLGAFRASRPVLTVGTAFYNGANYGFPFMLLVFGEYAVSVMGINVMVSSVLMATVAIVLMDPTSQDVKSAISRLLRIPIIYGIAAGLIVRAVGVTVPDPLQIPLTRLTDAYVALALTTLGAQLATVSPMGALRSSAAAIVGRLLISPIVALGMVQFFPLTDRIAPVLILATGLPTAVNTYILASEFENDPDVASLMVFWTTLLSAFTLPLWVLLVRGIYP